MFRDYYQVRDWLESFIPLVYGKEELGLPRIKCLLAALGNPQNSFKSIHIAGTSGKGSTAFYIAKLLERSLKLETRDKKRVKIGLHISPHLVDIRERMQILQSNDPVSKSSNDTGSLLMPMDQFIKLFNKIKSVVEKIQKEKPDLTPSYFEILVAASFLHFANEKVDWAVIETGLGGRLDATNVLNPQLTIITNIGLDHTDILGETVEEIAFEKAGIIKSKTPIITAAKGKALKIIEKVAQEKNAPLIKLNTQLGVQPLKSDTKVNLSKYYDIERYIPQNVVLENALLAVSALEILGLHPNQTIIKKAFSEPFPGRFEKVAPNIILDGAHNPDKIKFLIRWIKNSKQLTVNSQLTLVLAFKKGKDWQKMVDLLVKNLPVKQIITAKYHAVADTGLGSAVEPAEIRDYVAKVYSLQPTAYSNSQEAVYRALQSSKLPPNKLKANQLILVTGSLYLVGEVRTLYHLPAF